MNKNTLRQSAAVLFLFAFLITSACASAPSDSKTTILEQPQQEVSVTETVASGHWSLFRDILEKI
jgi:hypothetical protein